MNEIKIEIDDYVKLITTIRAPCSDLREAVRGAMRRSPNRAKFVGFELQDQSFVAAVDDLVSTGHSVLLN